jgi:hypothetical protein
MRWGLDWGKKMISKGEKLTILTALTKRFSRNSGPVWFVQTTSKGFKWYFDNSITDVTVIEKNYYDTTSYTHTYMGILQ